MYFQADRHTRIDKLMMEAQRHREHQEQPHRQAGQRIAEELAAGLLRQHPVPGDVGRQQPEIDQRVAGEPEVGARQLRVGAGDQPQRGRQQHRQDLDRDAQGGELPHDHRHQAAEGDKRRANAGVLLAPGHVGEVEAETFDPASDNDQRQPHIESPVRLQRRIERVENRGLIQQDRDRGGDQADHHHPEAHLVDHREAQPPLEPVGHGQREEAGDEEGRVDQRVQHAVQREALVVGAEERPDDGIEIPAGVLEGLQRPEECADRQCDQPEKHMPADETLVPGRKFVFRLQSLGGLHGMSSPCVRASR